MTKAADRSIVWLEDAHKLVRKCVPSASPFEVNAAAREIVRLLEQVWQRDRIWHLSSTAAAQHNRE